MPRKTATLAALALALLFAAPTAAQAVTLGAADGNIAAAPLAQQLGARTYRIAMDSTKPLDFYAARIEAYRAQGMRPQIVVDGGHLPRRGLTGKSWDTINYAIHAFRRWPDAYSVSVMNEPDLSGISACQYGRTFRRAYKMLKAAGVPRVLFGEFSPADPMRWTRAITRCVGPITADGFAWHCYDAHPTWHGIDEAGPFTKALSKMRSEIHTPRGFTLPLYCTEYGVMTRPLATAAGAIYAHAEVGASGAKRWRHALNEAKRRHVVQVVAWGILEVSKESHWDSSLADANGVPRPAFAAIVAAR